MATGNQKHDSQAVATKSRLRRFRMLAVLLALSPFLVFELACIALDWGHPDDYQDPFVGFSAVYPLFVPDDTGTNYEIPKARRQFFAPDSFPIQKAENTFRVFSFGGSTVQGRPFSKETSFTTWLKISLNEGDTSKNWEVVNCGGISYASYRLVPILQECLAYEPDLFILCTGHNEFLEDRTYDHIKNGPDGVAFVEGLLSRTRTYTLARQGIDQIRKVETQYLQNRPELPAEVDAWLDYRGGLDAYHWDEQWRADVAQHYEFNVRRMIRIAEAAGVPVVLIKPTSNLSDCPPFKSEHRHDLSAEELDKWQMLIYSARETYATDLPKSIATLKQALKLDNQYAATHFELGQCYQSLNDYDMARKEFLLARDFDVCPLRILSTMEEALVRVAHETKTPIIDAQSLLTNLSPQRIAGEFLLVDHIHPSIRGHQIIANAIADEFIRLDYFHPEGDWQEKRDLAFEQHRLSLDNMYYLHGRRMLDVLDSWTSGRADGPPLAEKPKTRNSADSDQ